MPDTTPPTDDAPPRRAVLLLDTQPEPTRVWLDFSGPQLVVGRANTDNPVDVDMTPYNAREFGMSSRHAVLHHQPDGIYIEDLGSTNGTRINGFPVSPHRAYRLRNDDELELGQLRAVIRFTP